MLKFIFGCGVFLVLFFFLLVGGLKLWLKKVLLDFVVNFLLVDCLVLLNSEVFLVLRGWVFESECFDDKVLVIIGFLIFFMMFVDGSKWFVLCLK